MSQIISTPLQYLHLWMPWKGEERMSYSRKTWQWVPSLTDDALTQLFLARYYQAGLAYVVAPSPPNCTVLLGGADCTGCSPAPLPSSHPHAAVTLVVRDLGWVAPRYSWLLPGCCWSCWSSKQSPGAMLAWLHCDNWLCTSSAHDKRRLRPWWNTFMLTHFS